MESRTVARPQVRRTTDDRVLAGVCGGLAERMRVDTVAIRILFVLGAMVWGLTVVVYALLWRFVPPLDSPTTNPVRPSRLPSMAMAAGAIAFMAAAMLGLRAVGLLPPDVLVLPLALAALGVMFVWSAQPLRPVDRLAIGSGEGEPADHDAAQADDEDPEVEFSDWDLRGRYSWTPPVEEAPARERAPFGTALISAVLVVACAGFLVDRAGWVDVQWRVLGAALLVAIGVVLIGGSTRGRPSGLTAIGAALLAVLVVASVFQVPLGSGVGARTLHPLDLGDVDTHLAGGTLTVDLSDYELDPAAPTPLLDASVAIGDLKVVVPAGVEVAVTARVGLGALTVFADARTGFGVEKEFVSSRYNAQPGQLAVRVNVGVGRVIVEQAR